MRAPGSGRTLRSLCPGASSPLPAGSRGGGRRERPQPVPRQFPRRDPAASGPWRVRAAAARPGAAPGRLRPPRPVPAVSPAAASARRRRGPGSPLRSGGRPGPRRPAEPHPRGGGRSGAGSPSPCRGRPGEPLVLGGEARRPACAPAEGRGPAARGGVRAGWQLATGRAGSCRRQLAPFGGAFAPCRCVYSRPR